MTLSPSVIDVVKGRRAAPRCYSLPFHTIRVIGVSAARISLTPSIPNDGDVR